MDPWAEEDFEEDAGSVETEGDGDPEASDPPTKTAYVADPASEPALRAWIARVVDRDQAALAALYEATVGRVYGLALRITRNVQMAEEAAEDTFWQVWRQAPRFDPKRGCAMAWIMTIARSRALDTLRRREPAECTADAAGLAEAGDDGQGDPQDLLAAVQAGSQLQAALGRLDPLPRQLVALAFFRGLSHEEISLHTGLPLGTVKSHIRRALGRLREMLVPAGAKMVTL